jgi:hypothetical protein
MQFTGIHSNSERFNCQKTSSTKPVEKPSWPSRKINNPAEKCDNSIIYNNVSQKTKKKT